MKKHYDELFAGFFEDEAENSNWAKLLEEARHVHFMHPESWKRDANFKDSVASKLALLIKQDRTLTRRLLGLNDRIVSMLTYRAVELLQSKAGIHSLPDRSEQSLFRGD